MSSSWSKSVKGNFCCFLLHPHTMYQRGHCLRVGECCVPYVPLEEALLLDGDGVGVVGHVARGRVARLLVLPSRVVLHTPPSQGLE
jgi:hypothetical protein